MNNPSPKYTILYTKKNQIGRKCILVQKVKFNYNSLRYKIFECGLREEYEKEEHRSLFIYNYVC